jgi:hypothetical protein
MDDETKQKLALLEQKLDAVYISAEKTRKYFLAVLIVTVVAFVLPLVGLVFAIPSFISSYTSLLDF